MKDELAGKKMVQFAPVRLKSCSYLTDDIKTKKVKGTKKCAIKWKLKFEDYKLCLEATQFENKINQPNINKLVKSVKNS